MAREPSCEGQTRGRGSQQQPQCMGGGGGGDDGMIEPEVSQSPRDLLLVESGYYP